MQLSLQKQKMCIFSFSLENCNFEVYSLSRVCKQIDLCWGKTGLSWEELWEARQGLVPKIWQNVRVVGEPLVFDRARVRTGLWVAQHSAYVSTTLSQALQALPGLCRGSANDKASQMTK